MRLALFFLTTSFCLRAAGTGAPLPDTVAEALKTAGIAQENVSIVVQGVDKETPLVSHNADQAMNPASVMKLLTSYAALELLGPAFTWKTAVFSDAPVLDGVLEGNLYFRGSGDPRLALEQFWLLLRQLRSRGLKDIRGNLVLDRSAYSLPAHNPGVFDNEPFRPYNVGPNALLVNFQSLSLTLHPDIEKQYVEIFVETPFHNLRIDNQLKLVNGACGDWREKFNVDIAGGMVRLAGDYPANCNDKLLHLSPWPADEQFERLFRALWRELGGTWQGAARAGVTPPVAQKIAVHKSPPLSEIIRDINKYSNNVMARQVFLALSGSPATVEGAARAVWRWLERKKFALPTLVLDNGSGLSRDGRISANELRQILQDAWKSPFMPELISSLPLAGVDGTLRKRLGGLSTYGRAHLKTGSLKGARSIAGYALDSRGRRWIIVFMINDPKSGAGGPAMDALVEWITR